MRTMLMPEPGPRQAAQVKGLKVKTEDSSQTPFPQSAILFCGYPGHYNLTFSFLRLVLRRTVSISLYHTYHLRGPRA